MHRSFSAALFFAISVSAASAAERIRDGIPSPFCSLTFACNRASVSSECARNR